MAISKKIILKTLPEDPGVYQFLSKEKKIIYVGKAKNLKKRVSSYFLKNIKSRKTLNLVKNTKFIEHAVVKSESDALLLENSLIKENQPKYNILLRDDKTYPWICIKNERFPRIFLTRKFIKDGSEYFGPYTNVKVINILLNLIRTLYPIRTSNYNFSQKQINNPKNEIFLNVHKNSGHSLILGFKKFDKIVGFESALVKMSSFIPSLIEDHQDIIIPCRIDLQYGFTTQETIRVGKPFKSI